MSLVNKKYIVLIDNGSTTEKLKTLCYMRTIRKSGKSFCEFAHTCSEGKHFTTKASATKCRDRLREGGYSAWVDTFYVI